MIWLKIRRIDPDVNDTSFITEIDLNLEAVVYILPHGWKPLYRIRLTSGDEVIVNRRDYEVIMEMVRLHRPGVLMAAPYRPDPPHIPTVPKRTY